MERTPVYRAARKVKKVLLVSYPFPPIGGIGVPRALGYARYLPAHGVQVFVLTASRPAAPVYDPELIKLVPADTTVQRSWNPELPFTWRDHLWKLMSPPHRNTGTEAQSRSVQASQGFERHLKESCRKLLQKLLFPDPQVTWVPFAVRAARKMIEQHSIDTIIVNAPPFSMLKIGVYLKRKYPNITLITDFRDDWLGYYVHQFDSPSAAKVQACQDLERQAVEYSDFVSTVTPSWVHGMRSRYPDQEQDKFILVPNGFDPDLFSDFSPRPRNDNKLVITYFGTVHNNRIYSPENYIRAIEALPEHVRSRIETRFVGRITPEAQRLFENRSAHLRCLGFMPKLQGIKLLEESDLLLLIATDPHSHAGKLFEYLATGKPIVALSPCGGEIDRVLAETRTGWAVDPWSHEAISALLEKIWLGFINGESSASADAKAVARYSWPAIVDSMLQTVAGPCSPVCTAESECHE